MAKHIVKCTICGEEFDLNSTQGVKHGARRYAHFECYKDGELVPIEAPKKAAEDPDLSALKDYINKKYADKANWALINKQIKKYHTGGYSYSSILKSLVYFYDVKKNTIDGSNGGIGIVEFCYKDSYNYFYSIWLAQQTIDSGSLVIKEKEFIIRPPQQRGTKNSLLDWSLDDEE